MEKKKKIIIWTKGIDNLIEEKGNVGGLTVQMYFWSQIFNEKGWDVYSLTSNITNNNKKQNGIHFNYLRRIRFLNILLDPFIIFCQILKLKPNIVLTRGATRNLWAINFVCKLCKIKLVHMLASDSDVQNGQELIKKSWDRFLYRKGLMNLTYVVVQNDYQQLEMQKLHPKVKCLLISNLWIPQKQLDGDKQNVEKDYILWVANYRTLKRPEWFLQLASIFPNEQFVMVGGSLNDLEYYEKCKYEASKIKNLSFKGPLNFESTNKMFMNAKLFVCTSEMEGFPNTFLQAWAYNIPVVSTVNPSNFITEYRLGLVIKTFDELVASLKQALTDETRNEFSQNISTYMKSHHNAEVSYNELTTTFDL